MRRSFASSGCAIERGDRARADAVIWSPEARADLQAIDRKTAMQILYCIDHYLTSRTGDVKKRKPPLSGFRLRCGHYRVFFDHKDENTVEITGIRNRKHAYRWSAKPRETHRITTREEWPPPADPLQTRSILVWVEARRLGGKRRLKGDHFQPWDRLEVNIAGSDGASVVKRYHPGSPPRPALLFTI